MVETNEQDSSYEAMGLGTFSNSPSIVVSIFETFWKQSGMYEKSQLHSAEDELNRMKQYLNEALEEVANLKKSRIMKIFNNTPI